MNLGPQIAEIRGNNERAKNNTGPYGDTPPPPKNQNFGLRHVLSWPKIGLEPKCHEAGTFGGFGPLTGPQGI